MKARLTAISFALSLCATSAYAQRMTTYDTFIGKVRSLAFGYYGETAIALQGGSCRNSEVVFLLKSNRNYDRIVAMLMTAISSGQIVKLARLDDNGTAANGSCIINEAALGDWPGWN